MLASALYFLTLGAPCALAAARASRRFEEVLPLSMLLLTVLLYAFGLAGALQIGVYASLVLAVLLYAWAGLCVLRGRTTLRALAARLFTPAGVLFMALCAVAVVCNYGRSLYHGDEFSHWAYTVKAMTLLDDFGTNPNAMSLYASYPPGMSLLQYEVQKLNCLFAGETVYSEWLLFVPYQTAAFACLLPFAGRDGWKRPFALLPAAAVMLALPALLDTLFYESLFVDPILGLLAGYTLSVVWRADTFDRHTCVTLCAALFTMTLIKDVGIFFAAVCLLAALPPLWRRGGAARFVRIGLSAGGAAAIALAKASWSMHVSASGVPVRFSEPADLSLLPAILTGAETGWRRTAFLRYCDAFFEPRMPLGSRSTSLLGVTTPDWLFYVSFCVLCAASVALLFFMARRRGASGSAVRASMNAVNAAASGGLIVYAIGLALLYTLKFVEFEALSLYCYERYFAIPVLMLLTVSWHAFDLQAVRARFWRMLLVAVCVVFLSPLHAVVPYLTRSAARGSAEMMQHEHALAARVERIAGEDGRVYLLAQQSDGEGLALRYLLFPKKVGGGGVGTPLYEGDTWTRDILADEWRETLAGAYDYVVLERLDDAFIARCGEAFTQPESIEVGAVYRVDEQTGMLTLVTVQEAP